MTNPSPARPPLVLDEVVAASEETGDYNAQGPGRVRLGQLQGSLERRDGYQNWQGNEDNSGELAVHAGQAGPVVGGREAGAGGGVRGG